MNTNSNKQTRRLTESQFQEHVAYLVAETLIREGFINEADMDEGFWNQMKQGAQSFFGNGYGKDNPKNYRNSVADRQARGEHTANWMNGSTPMNFKQRWNAAKTGYQQQGKVDEIDKVAKFLSDLVQAGKIDPNQTVGQLLQKDGKFQKGNLNQMRSQANSKISKANNDIYRGMQTGVMGSGRHTTVS